MNKDDKIIIRKLKEKRCGRFQLFNSNQIVSTLHSFKYIDCVTNENEAINYPPTFLNSLGVPDLPPHNL